MVDNQRKKRRKSEEKFESKKIHKIHGSKNGGSGRHTRQFLNLKDNEENPQAPKEGKKPLICKRIKIRFASDFLSSTTNLENNEIRKHCLQSSKGKGFCTWNPILIYILFR